MKKNGSIEPSMLQDLKKRKHCEVDFINGEVVRWGREYGVPTPINDRIVDIIKKEESYCSPIFFCYFSAVLIFAALPVRSRM